MGAMAAMAAESPRLSLHKGDFFFFFIYSKKISNHSLWFFLSLFLFLFPSEDYVENQNDERMGELGAKVAALKSVSPHPYSLSFFQCLLCSYSFAFSTSSTSPADHWDWRWGAESKSAARLDGNWLLKDIKPARQDHEESRPPIKVPARAPDVLPHDVRPLCLLRHLLHHEIEPLWTVFLFSLLHSSLSVYCGIQQ